MTANDLIDIRIEAASWNGAGWDAAEMCRDAALAAIAVAQPAWRNVEVSILLTGDEDVQALNRAYRGRDEATDVLSFPLVDVSILEDGRARSEPDSVLLGDIAVAHGVSAREAEEAGKPLADHLRHLIVHGVLHLLGYDHEVDADAEIMERLEATVLAGLGVPDPYEHEGAPDSSDRVMERHR